MQTVLFSIMSCSISFLSLFVSAMIILFSCSRPMCSFRVCVLEKWVPIMSSFSVVLVIMKLPSVSLMVLCIVVSASWMREAFSEGNLRGGMAFCPFDLKIGFICGNMLAESFMEMFFILSVQ